MIDLRSSRRVLKPSVPYKRKSMVSLLIALSLIMTNYENSAITVESFIRGYHVYKDVAAWDPQIQEERDLKRDPHNIKDTNAVPVVQPLISLETSASQPSESSGRISKGHHAKTVDEQEDEILGHIPL